MSDIQKLLVGEDSTRLPPISNLIGRDWSPRHQHQWHHAPSSGGLLNLGMLATKNDLLPPLETQDTRSRDGLIASTAEMNVPSHNSVLLGDHEEASNDASSTLNNRENVQNHEIQDLTTEDDRQPDLDQNMDDNFVPQDNEEPPKPRNIEADAMFLLNILHLAEIDTMYGMPTLQDLHSCPPSNPQTKEITTSSIHDLQLSDQTICLGAALLQRACCLRRSRPIFTSENLWYEESATPHATIAGALRVAQLYLEPGLHDAEGFYTAWGFYPYEELTRFARLLGDPEMKTPVANVDWDQWCALKKEFERGVGVGEGGASKI